MGKMTPAGIPEGALLKVCVSFQGLYVFLWYAYDNTSLSPINTVPEKA